jgi:glycosyltransferase involved in cell wall biosynthesis
LVVVGMPGPESADLYAFVHAAHLGERISFVSGISDAELHWCYRNCEVLLVPSTMEGFGLPVIEGLFAGCRIVCSDIPAFREVGGEKCRFVEFGTDAQEAFAREIVASLREPRPAPALLPHLAPGHISQQYLKLYQLLLAVPGVSSDAVGQRYAPARATSVADEVPTAAHS